MKALTFWTYSLRAYGRAGVEPACLALQEEGANVNLLLLCCWLGAAGRRLDRRQLRRTISKTAAWQQQIVVPLRQLRRGLKSESWPVSPTGRRALRASVAAAELEAEHLEQLLLADLVAHLVRRAGKNFSAENLAGYAAVLGVDFGAHWKTLATAAGGAVAAPC